MQRIAILLALLAAACHQNQHVFARSTSSDTAKKEDLRKGQKLGKRGAKVDPSKTQILKNLEELDGENYSSNLNEHHLSTEKISFIRPSLTNKKVENRAGKIEILTLEPLNETGFFSHYWSIDQLGGQFSEKAKASDVLDSHGFISPKCKLPQIVIVGISNDGVRSENIVSGYAAYLLAGLQSDRPVSAGEIGHFDLNPSYADDLLYFSNESISTEVKSELIEWEMDESPSQQAINLDEYLQCFDNIPDGGASYIIKVMVDIPVDANPNSLINVGATGLSVGHVFLTITKSNGSNSISQTLGFYPASDYKSLTLTPVTSKLADDGKGGGNHEFNASLLLDGWNTAEFKALLNQLRLNSTMKYEIDGFNCANFIGSSLNAVKPNTLNSVATTGINPLNPTELISIPWSPNGVYKALVDQKASNPSLPISTGVVNQSSNSSGPCF